MHDMILEGRPISKGSIIELTDERLESAHRYVLFNTAEIEPYLHLHLAELKHSDKRLSRNEGLLWKRYSEEFSSWFEQKIEEENRNDISMTLKCLACGPQRQAVSYNAYIINDQRYHIKDVEKSTQNNGVLIELVTVCQSSSKDTNSCIDTITYYGVIKDILLLDYYTLKIPLFDGNWTNIRNGVKFEDGFTLVNLHQGQHQFARDSFILASQAKQVFYSRENDSSSWYVVLRAPPRGFHELDNYAENCITTLRPLDVSRLDNNKEGEDGSSRRENYEGIYI
ncbi:uncharacterized protein LOC107178836 [Citrus sinensis]|nr:uncharacterized protein LOC107178836 [Citrus sinensis]XP_052296470.1 uncharacterized protein LOC107178836 [Citrus sinensis]